MSGGGPASEEFHDGSLKENPSVRLVRIVLSGLRIEIDSMAIEIAIVADQKDVDRGIGISR